MCECVCVFSMPGIVPKVQGRCVCVCVCACISVCECARPHCAEVEQRLCVYVSEVSV